MRVLIVCGAGMSSGLIANKTRQAAKKRGIKASVDARSQSDVSDYLSSIDVLLLGPHYASLISEFEEMTKPFNVPVAVIPRDMYGAIDGEGVLDIALEALNEGGEK